MPLAQTPTPQEVELLIEKPDEVLRLLRRLAAKRSLITMHAPGGAPVLLSAVLDIDGNRGQMVIDASADSDANARALRYPELRCVGQVDSIGVRFSLQDLQSSLHDGMPAFQAPIPAAVLHLQRREYYRLRLPVSRALECRIPVQRDPGTDPHQVPEAVGLRLIDISAGGIALRVPPECVYGFAPGTAFDACVLLLPECPPLQVDMVVRHLAERRYEEGPGVWQAGCEFVDPPHAVQQRVQQFIMRVERELAARARGKA